MKARIYDATAKSFVQWKISDPCDECALSLIKLTSQLDLDRRRSCQRAIIIWAVNTHGGSSLGTCIDAHPVALPDGSIDWELTFVQPTSPGGVS